MSCTAIMTKSPPTIPGDATVAGAAAILVEHHYTSLPVVDAAGGYVGMFGICDLLGLLVPRVALAGDLTSNLRFLSGDAGVLRRRYEEVKCRRVSEVADRDGAQLDSDAHEIEAIRLCCRSRTPISVVEKTTGRLIGIITSRDVLCALVGAPQQP